jgi:signal transduction histidine kinase
VGELLDGVRELLFHTIGKTIEIEARVEPGLPPVLADKAQLETALINLASNARDAMPDGGRLTVLAELEDAPSDAAARRLGVARPGRYVRFTVSDTGQGMEPTRSRRPRSRSSRPRASAGGPDSGFPWCTGSRSNPVAPCKLRAAWATAPP